MLSGPLGKAGDALAARKQVIAAKSGGNKNKKEKRRERNCVESTVQPTNQSTIPIIPLALSTLYLCSSLSLPRSLSQAAPLPLLVSLPPSVRGGAG